MSRTRLGAAVLLGAAFFVGALAGGVAVSVVDAGDRPPRRGGGRPSHMARLTEELTLSPAQQDSIQAVYDRNQPLMESLWRELRPQFDSIRVGLRDEVRRQLTPDQQARYTIMIEKQDSAYRMREQRGRNGRN